MSGTAFGNRGTQFTRGKASGAKVEGGSGLKVLLEITDCMSKDRIEKSLRPV
jgi:hypothetical protein